jgi:hypothetical protein
MPVCIYLDYVNLAALPSAPAGFSLGVSARVRVTDAAGGALPAFAFAQPASLSLRVDGVSGAAPDVTTVDIGFLGETSSDWVIVEAERDQTASLLTAHPRRAGVYALLVRLPAPAESQPVSSSAGTRLLLPLAGLAFVLLALALLVILGRRR